MNKHSLSRVSVMFAVMLCVFIPALNATAQEIDYARENAQFTFSQTRTLRNELASADSAHTAIMAYRQWLDSVLGVYDSIARVHEPYLAYPAFRRGGAAYSPVARVILQTCADRAKPLYDSAQALRTLVILRNAMHVDSVGGVIDLIPIPDELIYRVREDDSAFVFVQTAQPHHIGDTIHLFAAGFGRTIFLSRSDSGAWEMAEGIPAQRDSTFNVLRETPRPHVYDQYAEFSARFALLRALSLPLLDTSLAELHRQLLRDDAAAEQQYDTYDDSLRAIARRLWGVNMLLESAQSAMGGSYDDYLKAVDILLRLQSADSSFIPLAGDPLEEARGVLDSLAHLKLFGADGMKNMALIPGGAVTLHTGERFSPSRFCSIPPL